VATGFRGGVAGNGCRRQLLAGEGAIDHRLPTSCNRVAIEWQWKERRTSCLTRFFNSCRPQRARRHCCGEEKRQLLGATAGDVVCSKAPKISLRSLTCQRIERRQAREGKVHGQRVALARCRAMPCDTVAGKIGGSAEEKSPLRGGSFVRRTTPCVVTGGTRSRSSRAAQGLLVDFFDLEAACSSSRCLRESPIISRQMRSST
jgi:hypothetical protein